MAVVGGWLADRAIGEPPRAHPVAAFGRFAEAVERRWWRDTKTVGAAYATVLVAGPAVLARGVDRGLTHRPGRRAALLAAVLATAIGGRRLGVEARAVGRAVAADDLAGARARLPALCGRDPAGLDAAALCRAAVESVAENTSDAVVAPLWWAALAGAPGVVAHRAANTLDGMVGNRSARHARFGAPVARVDDVLGWVPARLTAALIAVAAPAVGGSPRAALTTWRRDGRRHASPNAGRCEAAMAGALGVGLGGPAAYPDHAKSAVTGPYGDGGPPTPDDVDRAVRLSLVVGAAAALLCAVLAAAVRAVVPAAVAGPACARGRGSATIRPQLGVRPGGDRAAEGRR